MLDPLSLTIMAASISLFVIIFMLVTACFFFMRWKKRNARIMQLENEDHDSHPYRHNYSSGSRNTNFSGYSKFLLANYPKDSGSRNNLAESSDDDGSTFGYSESPVANNPEGSGSRNSSAESSDDENANNLTPRGG
jgi:hypothetical protein